MRKVEGDPVVPEEEEIQRDGLVGVLKELTISVERLWRLADSDNNPDTAVALGDASQSLYRALIALDGAESER